MLRMWTSLVLITGFFTLNGQDSLKMNIQPQCTLSIQGQTNVNTFTCSQKFTASVPALEFRNEEGSIAFTGAEVSIPVNDFDCGLKLMTRDFQEILESEKYPHLQIILHEIISDKDNLQALVTIRLAGVSRKLSIPVTLNTEGQWSGNGECEVSFSQFELEPPVKFMGMVKVKEELKISFNIRITQIQ